LVCAGSLSFQDAVALVARRGEFMQAAVSPGAGAMAAIVGLPDGVVADICQEAVVVGYVAPANFNSPGQVVIAGVTAAVESAMGLAKARGARLVKALSVSVPSHCALMESAANNVAITLAQLTLHSPLIPVIGNADVKVYVSATEVREGLVRQLTAPVRWVETIRFFVERGVTSVIECGPGSVLTGLNKRIDASLQLTACADPVSLFNLLALQ
jgi:[acyl-carrier-protein] S-malonyltransferase